jgi:hypothetical protein
MFGHAVATSLFGCLANVDIFILLCCVANVVTVVTQMPTSAMYYDRRSVSQPTICFGIRHPSGARDQFFSFPLISLF